MRKKPLAIGSLPALVLILLLTAMAPVAFANPLLDDSADARTRQVWDYLQAQYGKKMLTGCWTETQYGGAQAFHQCTGEWPAIFGQDMNSWYQSRTDKLWADTWAGNIAQFKTAWGRHEIIQVNWHWQNVAHKDAKGAYTDDSWSELTAQEWADLVTPGTALYNAMIEDVDYHVVNFLKKLTDAAGPIPILFRPLHEIDGGWFWWTCKSDPAKTAKLYAILQDRIIKYHHMHNLIWIYNPGVLCDGGSWPPYEASEFPRRKAFYVGDARCDLVGIDLYDWDWMGKGTYAPDGKDYGKTYRDAWNEMKAITTTKMIALSECQGFPDPAKSITDTATFAPWLYALPWYSDEANGVSCSVLSPRTGSPYMLNAGDLPDFSKASALAPERKRTRAGWAVTRGKTSLWIAPLGARENAYLVTDASGKIILSPQSLENRAGTR
jgi:mannan endo-1,4-beta-mannosidase